MSEIVLNGGGLGGNNVEEKRAKRPNGSRETEPGAGSNDEDKMLDESIKELVDELNGLGRDGFYDDVKGASGLDQKELWEGEDYYGWLDGFESGSGPKEEDGADKWIGLWDEDGGIKDRDEETSGRGESGNDNDGFSGKINIDRTISDESLVDLRQRVVNFIASGGNFWYLENKEDNNATREKIWEKDVLRLLSGKFVGGIREREAYEFVLELAKKMLEKIPGAMEQRDSGIEEVWDRIKGEKTELKVLGYLLRGEKGFAAYEKIDIEDLVELAEKFKTPLELEWRMKRFGQDLKERSKKIYLNAEKELLEKVYGRKMEYYLAIKQLEKEAYAKYQGELDEREVIVEGANKPPMIKWVGAITVNKANINSEGEIEWHKSSEGGKAGEGRLNEDAAYVNTELGLCAVADGAGAGGGDPARASRMVINSVRAASNSTSLETPEDLGRILELAGKRIGEDPEAGISTAVVARIIKKRGLEHQLIFASVGDSRIYIVRGGKLIQVTTDEGVGNIITNAVGTERGVVKQVGKFTLKMGDILVLNTDGVTGDNQEQAIPEDDFVSAVSGKSAEAAARRLVEIAKKPDDRTVIVVPMNGLWETLTHLGGRSIKRAAEVLGGMKGEGGDENENGENGNDG